MMAQRSRRASYTTAQALRIIFQSDDDSGQEDSNVSDDAWKKHFYKKLESDIYHKFNYVTFYLKLRQDFCISDCDIRLYKV